MNVKKQILSALLLLAALTVSAQEPQGETVYDFKPHWFLQVQPVGGQYTLGEVDFSHLASYNVQAALGYQFNKIASMSSYIEYRQIHEKLDDETPHLRQILQFEIALMLRFD